VSDGVESLIGVGPRALVRLVGGAIGAAAMPGDVIALTGGLGAGKTFLAAAIARGAGVPPGTRVASPTFTLIHSYSGRLPVTHADLYRIETSGELRALGLFDQSSDGVLIAEWADRFPTAFPADTLWIRLERRRPLSRSVFVTTPGARAAYLADAARVAIAARRSPRVSLRA